MPLSILLLAVLLSQGPSPAVPSRGVISSNGHTYQLFCAQQGELIVASETGVCEKTEAGGVQRFEIRDEDGEAAFSEDAPEGGAFTYVGMSSTIGGPRDILTVEVSSADAPAGKKDPGRILYYFDLAPSGLVRFEPALVGVDGFAHLDNGVAVSRTFDAGFFQFSVLLGFNFVTHRIGILPDQPVFPALPPPGRDKPQTSASSGGVKLRPAHDNAAPATDLKILPGHKLAWWQSLAIDDGSSAAQNIKVLAVWAPASLRPADNAPEGVQMVYYDWNNLWLQIEVDQDTGWIRGASNFRLIGLQMAEGQH